MSQVIRRTCILLVTLAVAGTLQAQVEPGKAPDVAAKAFRHPDLTISAYNDEIGQLPPQAAAQARERLARLGVDESSARVDRRGGRFVTLLPTEPMVPGRGVGNELRWADLKVAAPQDRAERERAAGDAFLAYLDVHRTDLGIDPGELAGLRVVSHGDGDLYQIHAGRTFDGVRVRDSYLTAVVGQGNLILFGAHQWGDTPPPSGRPRLSSEEARAAATSYLAPLAVTGEWGKTELVYVPAARGQAPQDVGNGYRYELVWSVKWNVEEDAGSWELLVDAHTGDVLSNEDQNQYSEVKGGVYPVTNDGIAPDGVEQPGWPMPFADVGAETATTGGVFSSTATVTTDFYGPYVNVNDNCGTSSLTGSIYLDWGTSGGSDCATPGLGGPGNTHAARTCFYWLNRIKEVARGWLPGNSWLSQRLTCNVNINSTCNAYWNGSVNFYRSGGGCSNTCEIAGVAIHEWGHGMDANDDTPGISGPSGEGIADVYTALCLHSSCIGRNFRPGIQCSGYGDPCTDCTGVRDIDYLRHLSGSPHTYTWANANCGGSVHCTGAVYSEAIWSLWKRQLQQAPYNYDDNTAHEIVSRLTYLGAGNVTTWFSGGPPWGGCAAGSGYMSFLAADDDNGNINDGTPHMGAIFSAFNDQEIACNTPAVQDSGCAGTPTSPPNVTATVNPGKNSITLSWNPVPGATEYHVFRSEGIFACDFCEAKVGAVTSTSFTDTGLQHGRDYSYVVIPMGGHDACFGPASACVTVTPEPCVIDAECDDGLWCNGAETCFVGFCQNGTDPCAANPTWTCDEIGDVCVPVCTVAADCDDGIFCNGAEVCNAGTCGPGTVPCAGQCCDEATTSCGFSNDPQSAVYDVGLGAPVCVCGSSCDSQGLLDGRGNVGPEPNQPNTLDTCTDGTSGTYHNDESNDRIVVTNLSGTDFQEGDTVEIAATVWAWSTGSSDAADFYYAADANNPSWTYIGSVVPPAGGVQTLTQQYTLPAGCLQAVRVNFRYSGSVSSCTAGAYDDRDDLVFPVRCSSGGVLVNKEPDGSVRLPPRGSFYISPSKLHEIINGLPPGTKIFIWAIHRAFFCKPPWKCRQPGGTLGGGKEEFSSELELRMIGTGELAGFDRTIVLPVQSETHTGPRKSGTFDTKMYALQGNLTGDPDFDSFTVTAGELFGLPSDGSTTLIDQGDGTVLVKSFFDINYQFDFVGAASGPLAGMSGSSSDTVRMEAACAEPGTCPVAGCAADEDFEAGAVGWINDPASTCTTGAYVIGDPTNPGGGVQIDGSHSGTSSVFTAVNTSAGVNDVDGGNCILGSPSWTVPNASTLSVWYWHGQRDAGDDAAGDFFHLEYSTNGGSSWTTLVSGGDTTSNPAWTEATASIPAGSAVKLRMQCSDGAAAGDLVECGLDDVSICAN